MRTGAEARQRCGAAIAFCTALSALVAAGANAASAREYQVASPDGALSVRVAVGPQILWSARKGDQRVIEPSAIGLELGDGTVLGRDAQVKSAKVDGIDTSFPAINYVRAVVRDRCNQLTVDFSGDFSLVFRVYDDAVAYRFVTRRAGELIVRNEQVSFNLTGDHRAFIPYMWDYREGQVFNASFESPYTEARLSEWQQDSLSILPMLVSLENQRKLAILEADLEDYPGLYLKLSDPGKGLSGVFPRYPLETRRSGAGRGMNVIPTKRADFIAKTKGTRSFPWRVVIVSETDTDLLSNDVVQRLAAPPRIGDTSWIEVGQVSWDWWNDYALTGVDFRAGMNTSTFEHYIDFAAENGAKHVILDAGWSDTFDLDAVNPDVNLPRILAHARQRNVGVILWAAWYTVTQQMHEAFPKYAGMGVKGFKIDFIDRDDQIAVDSTYQIAKLAAQHRLMVDYHGIFKPTGLQRTYPNVVGYEGVYGLEYFKWHDRDTPRYTVTIPYVRNLAGPMDYTRARCAT